MEPAWERIAESKFRLGTYKDANEQLRPCYLLTKTECLYIATKFNDEARARLLAANENVQPALHVSLKQVAHLLPLMQGEVVLPKLEAKGREWWRLSAWRLRKILTRCVSVSASACA